MGSIHFIPGMYPYWASLLTPLHFRIPSLIFGHLVAKYLAENGVSGTFWKNYWLNSFRTWHLPLWVSLLIPVYFRVPSLIFGLLVAKYWVENRVSGTWIFLDEMGSDQRGVYCPHLWAQLVFTVNRFNHINYIITKNRTLIALDLDSILCPYKLSLHATVNQHGNYSLRSLYCFCQLLWKKKHITMIMKLQNAIPPIHVIHQLYIYYCINW